MSSRADVVLDTVGRDSLARSYAVVKKGGIVTTIASRPDQAQLDKYGIRAHVDLEPLTDAVKASQQAETHHTRGKLVLKIEDEPTN